MYHAEDIITASNKHQQFCCCLNAEQKTVH